jgi:hypothetical protein
VRLRTLTALLLVLAACAIAGCGADEETKPSIPAASANELLTQLGSVQDRFDFGDGACNDIPENQQTVNDQIAALPSSVDADVRNALQDSFDHLFDLTSEQCDKTKGQQTDTQTEPTNTEPTNTEPTNTEPTNTEPTNTEPTNTEPTNTEPTDTGPPEQPGGGGGAQGPGL